MARLSLRDRFFTPRVARAIVSPGAVLALVGGAAVGLVLGGGVVGAIGLALVAFGARVVAAIPRAEKEERIDPFTLSEPWRHYVHDAVQARSRFRDAIERAHQGPLRERLEEIGERVETGVRDVWRIACGADDLGDARRRVDPDSIRREIGTMKAHASEPGATSPALERTMASLEAQLATAQRLERVIADADSQLRLLNARLDEAAVRTIELSVQANDVTDLSGLGRDVDDMVLEMEALRQAIEETGGGSAVSGSG